jgi:DnaJ-domain-containing protein 1
LSTLESHFLKASFCLHPDKFTLKNQEQKERSLLRMSFINQAYSTLKKQETKRAYLLSLKNVKYSFPPPFELVTKWFSIQEEDFNEMMLQDFQKEIENEKKKFILEIESKEKKYDSLMPSQEEEILLKSIAENIQHCSYLNSLAKEVHSFLLQGAHHANNHRH